MTYATIDDVNVLFRQLTEEETTKATSLLEIVSDRLRYEAELVGKDLDEMINNSDVLSNVAKSITVDIVGRNLMTSTNSEPMTQMSQSANGYSYSGSFLVPGGGLFIKNSELKALGLKKQRYGVIDL